MAQLHEKPPSSRTTIRCTDSVHFQTHELVLDGFEKSMFFDGVPESWFNRFKTEPFQLAACEDGSVVNSWQVKLRLESINYHYQQRKEIVYADIFLLDTKPEMRPMNVYITCYLFKDGQFRNSSGAELFNFERESIDGTVNGRWKCCPLRFRIADKDIFDICIRKGPVKIRFTFDHYIENVPDNLLEIFPGDSASQRYFVNSGNSVLSNLISNPRLSDLAVLTGDGDLIPVHKLILASQSPVFERMFTVEMIESCENQLAITDFPSDAVKCFLRYLYCDEGAKGDCENFAEDLLVLGEKYQIVQLKLDAEGHISTRLNPDTVCQHLVLADLNGAPKLEKYCIDYIIKNRSRIIGLDTFKELRENHKDVFQRIVDASFGN